MSLHLIVSTTRRTSLRTMGAGQSRARGSRVIGAAGSWRWPCSPRWA